VLCRAAPSYVAAAQDVVAKAKDMHPKLAVGMFVFFALGAVGGMMSLIMQDRPIFER
jgi:F0F1-type ATP synthase membrane subunit c/vacuolar-type H+-ATPase subunit K